MKLNEITFIRTGLVLNRKEATSRDSNQFKYKQLTLKSISNNSINENYLEYFISSEPLKEEYLTQENDVIVRLSHPYTAVVVGRQSQGIVVSSHFIIIRCDLDKILPKYLQHILNSDTTYKKIFVETSTSVLKSIRPSFYSELDINLIAMEKQMEFVKMINKLDELSNKEIVLLEQLRLEKQRYYTLLKDKIQKEMEML